MMTIIELPYLFLGLLCFLLPFYWLTGLQNSGTEFFKFVLVGFLMVLFFSFMEQIYIAGLPNLIAAQALNGLFMSLFFAFGGLFIKPSAIPIGWKWFYCQYSGQKSRDCMWAMEWMEMAAGRVFICYAVVVRLCRHRSDPEGVHCCDDKSARLRRWTEPSEQRRKVRALMVVVCSRFRVKQIKSRRIASWRTCSRATHTSTGIWWDGCASRYSSFELSRFSSSRPSITSIDKRRSTC